MLSLGIPKPYPSMSWSKRYVTQAALVADIAADSGYTPEESHQINQARLEAQTLIGSGIVGSSEEDGPQRDYEVILSGHATSGHSPQEGEQKDWIRVEIRQK